MAELARLDAFAAPVTYRPGPLSRLAGTAGGVAMIAGCGVLAAVAQAGAGPARGLVLSLVLILTLFAPGLYLLVGCQRWATTLHADRVESHGVFLTRALQRADIKGIRRRPGPRTSFRAIRVIPRSADVRPLFVSAFGREDPVFHAWFEAFPNLDAEADEAALARELSDRTWGDTAEARVAALARAQTLSRLFAIAGLALGVWGYIYPEPRLGRLTALAAAPVAALAWVGLSRGRWTLIPGRAAARPNVAAVLTAPCLVLGVRAWTDMHIVDWGPALEAAAMLALAMAGAGLAIDRASPNPAGRFIALLALGLAYGWGLVGEANAGLDAAPAPVITTRVLEASATHGRGASYRLRLAPWSEDAESMSVTVPYGLYRRVHAGDVVCVTTHRGAFQMRWFTVAVCQDGEGAAASTTPLARKSWRNPMRQYPWSWNLNPG